MIGKIQNSFGRNYNTRSINSQNKLQNAKNQIAFKALYINGDDNTRKAFGWYTGKGTDWSENINYDSSTDLVHGIFQDVTSTNKKLMDAGDGSKYIVSVDNDFMKDGCLRLVTRAEDGTSVYSGRVFTDNSYKERGIKMYTYFDNMMKAARNYRASSFDRAFQGLVWKQN